MNSNGNSLFQPRATVGSILSERNNFLYSKNACKKLSGEGQERGHAPVLRRVASGSNLPRWRRVDELNDCETVMREMTVSEDRTKRMDPSSPLPVILPPRRGTAFSMTSVMSIPRNSVVEHGDYEGLMTVISGDLSYPILSQLFFHFIVDEHNDLVSHIRGLNEEAFVSRVRSKGKRSGMRRVGLSDAHFLLTASLDTKNKEKTGQSSDYANYHAEFSDVKALFNLADWRQKGSVDFETFIHTLHLLFRPKSIFGVLWCRALLRTKQLDTAVLTLEEVEIVLQAVMDTFSRYDSDKITSICRAVRREVMMVSIDACVPVSFLRDVMQKFPTLSKYLNLINEDGTVQSPVPPVDEMRELVRGPADTKVYIRSPSCTGRSAVRRRNRLAFERTEENSKVVEFVRDIYARGDSHSWTSPSEGYAALQRAAKHPRFICDQYADKTRPATPPLQLPNFAAVPPCPATSLALSYLQPKEPRYIEGSSST